MRLRAKRKPKKQPIIKPWKGRGGTREDPRRHPPPTSAKEALVGGGWGTHFKIRYFKIH